MEDCAGSVQAIRVRLAKLDESGAPLAGAGNVYSSKGLVSLQFTPEYEEGEEQTQKNGAGEICIQYKDEDRLKRINLELVICTPDPELHALLAGGDLVTDGGDVIGYNYPAVGSSPNPNGVSIEAWSKAIVDGHIAEDRPYIRWVFPRVKFRVGQKTLENSPMTHPFTGAGEENPAWLDGPANDWPHIDGRMAGFARDDAIPDATCGATALLAS